MDLNIKIKWIEALTSDRYQQGYGALRRKDNRFCCLGVLCDILDPYCWSKDDPDCYSHHGAVGRPDDFINLQAGLTLNQIEELVTLNDNGEIFSTIAEYIRENF